MTKAPSYTGCGGTTIKRSESGERKLIGEPCEGCPDCQPKPSEGAVSEERLRRLAVMHFNLDFLPDRDEFFDIQKCMAELIQARATIAALNRKLDQAEAVRSEEAFAGALADQVRDSRISQLEDDLAAARLNERRYLWLRPHLFAQQGDVQLTRNSVTLPFGVDYHHLSGDALDEAIDIGVSVDLPERAAIAAGDGK